MSTVNDALAPEDADERRSKHLVLVYPSDRLPKVDLETLKVARKSMQRIDEIIVAPRDANFFRVPRGHFFRITSIEGPQVGDFNLWNANDLSERFFSGKTRALHGTHVGVGDQLWTNLPYMRPMATITHDTLGWYGYDDDGAGVHDVIGTRCDPYTNRLLNGSDYHHCCHSNLTRALAKAKNLELADAEPHVHDVLNVFMCTGFTKDTHQYFMKASPVRPEDYVELFAEIDLLGALSACPGGDCGSEHSSDQAACYPLKVEIFRPDPETLANYRYPEINPYPRSHGVVQAG